MSVDPAGSTAADGGQAMAGTVAATPTAETPPPPRPPYVIDTSVAMKWYIPEDDSSDARAYMALGLDLHAPDLLPIEAGHALLKRVRSAAPDRHLPSDKARRIVAILRDSAPIQYHASSGLIEPAFALAEHV